MLEFTLFVGSVARLILAISLSIQLIWFVFCNVIVKLIRTSSYVNIQLQTINYIIFVKLRQLWPAVYYCSDLSQVNTLLIWEYHLNLYTKSIGQICIPRASVKSKLWYHVKQQQVWPVVYYALILSQLNHILGVGFITKGFGTIKSKSLTYKLYFFLLFFWRGIISPTMATH